MSICLSPGCCNKLAETEWLINNRNISLTVLEAESLRSRWWQIWCLARAPSLLQIAAFSLCPHMAEGALWSRHPLLKALISFMRAPPSWRTTSQRPPASNTITLGVKISTPEFGREHKYIIHKTFCIVVDWFVFKDPGSQESKICLIISLQWWSERSWKIVDMDTWLGSHGPQRTMGGKKVLRSRSGTNEDRAGLRSQAQCWLSWQSWYNIDESVFWISVCPFLQIELVVQGHLLRPIPAMRFPAEPVSSLHPRTRIQVFCTFPSQHKMILHRLHDLRSTLVSTVMSQIFALTIFLFCWCLM